MLYRSRSFKSELARVKGLGSAHSGVHHWYMQRFTALFLIITTMWLVYFCYEITHTTKIINVIAKPWHGAMIILTVIISFYHASLGMQVIIEDYITCRLAKLILLAGMQIFAVITVMLFMTAMIKIMVLS